MGGAIWKEGGEEAGQFREWRKRKLKTKIEPKGQEECKICSGRKAERWTEMKEDRKFRGTQMGRKQKRKKDVHSSILYCL